MEDKREILTLQIGGYSNWVGAHTWNLISSNRENDKDSEELFDSETKENKPRVAIFDLRNRRGGLFMPEVVESETPPWSNNVDKFCTELHPKLNLNWDSQDSNEVDLNQSLVWSDFMTNPLNESSHKEVPFWDVRNGAFSSFASGDFQHPDCILSVDYREECIDVLRLLLERSDQPQGCQCIFDVQGGFAGLASSVVSEFRDQCRSSAISCNLLLNPPTLPTDAPQNTDLLQSTRRHDSRTHIDHAITMHAILEHTNVLFPLNCSHPTESNNQNVDALGLLQHSAQMATFIDTCSLPYRRPYDMSRKLMMTEWCSILTPRRDLRVMSAEMCIPDLDHLPPPPSSSSLSSSSSSPSLSFVPLDPSMRIDSSSTPPKRWTQLMVGRGVDKHHWPLSQDLAPSVQRYSFDAVVLPRSYPQGIFPPKHPPVPMRQGSLLTSSGSSSALHPWLSSLSSSLVSHSAEEEAGRRESQMSTEDSNSIAEDLMCLADSYSTD